jgi:uncharacterized repeat protein (TIGR01451 family)
MWFSSRHCWAAGARLRKFRPVLEALESRLAPAIFTVTSLADSNVAGSGTLRRAITDSNAGPGPNEIDILTAGTYRLTLPGTVSDNSAGELAILNNDVTIVNKSGGAVVIDASNLIPPHGVFVISPPGNPITVTITGVTIQGGDTTGVGGGIFLGGTSTLTLNNDVVQANRASSGGGGIYAAGGGTVNINDSLILFNDCLDSSAVGGGVAIIGTGAAHISDSEFSGNGTAGDGGGFFEAANELTIFRSTFNGNRAGGDGGALYLGTGVEGLLSNITVSGNSAGLDGGGIARINARTITLANSSIVKNAAGQRGGGIISDVVENSLQVSQTIVAKNSAAAGDPDVDNNLKPTDLVDEGSNFIGDNTGAADSFAAGTPNANGSWVGTAFTPLDPLLEPLADNGGTLVLPDGSHLLTLQDQPISGNNGVRGRAVGAGLNVPATDERGFPRPAGAPFDIGAFQFQDCDLSVSTSASAGTVRGGQPVTFTLAVTNNGPNPTPYDPILTATLPAGTAVVSASGNATANGNVVTFLLPPLAVGGSASFTLTITPAASGPFTETASVSGHDDPNLANNTASASITVQPRPFPVTGPADVTSLVQLVHLNFHRRPVPLLFFKLTNVSSTPIQGPMGVVVPGLRPRRGLKLLDASGTTAGGQKYVGVNLGSDNICDPGTSAVVELVFSQPFTPHTLDVLAGAFA